MEPAQAQCSGFCGEVRKSQLFHIPVCDLHRLLFSDSGHFFCFFPGRKIIFHRIISALQLIIIQRIIPFQRGVIRSGPGYFDVHGICRARLHRITVRASIQLHRAFEISGRGISGIVFGKDRSYLCFFDGFRRIVILFLIYGNAFLQVKILLRIFPAFLLCIGNVSVRVQISFGLISLKLVYPFLDLFLGKPKIGISVIDRGVSEKGLRHLGDPCLVKGLLADLPERDLGHIRNRDLRMAGKLKAVVVAGC